MVTFPSISGEWNGHSEGEMVLFKKLPPGNTSLLQVSRYCQNASIGKLGVVSHFLKCARSDVREQLMLVNKYPPWVLNPPIFLFFLLAIIPFEIAGCKFTGHKISLSSFKLHKTGQRHLFKIRMKPVIGY